VKIAIKATIEAVVFLGLMAAAIPYLVMRWTGAGTAAGAERAAGIAVAGAGLLLGLWCISLFVRVGGGTQAPVAPPTRLVTVGPYARMRNPMLLGVTVLLLGEALIFNSAAVMAWAAAFFVVANVLLVAVEEPTLRRRFDGEYEAYLARVPRWLPRLR
jgi:protein-S-isoprenylcysteine O-methyltransferase Ste14